MSDESAFLYRKPKEGYPCELTYCCLCGCDKLQITWKLKSESDSLRKALCHDGYGFQIEDAIFKCSACGKEWDYDEG